MRRFLCIASLGLALVSSAQLLPNFGGQRAGLSALSFLKNDVNPRSFGVAGAGITLSPSAFGIETNPASLAHLESPALGLSNTFIGAGLNQSLVASAFALPNSGVLGVHINSLNTDAMEVRTEFQPEGTGELFYANNTALGLTYAQKLTTQFSIGVGLRYVYEGIYTYSNHTLTADIGFLYQTDFKDLTFAVVIKNFGGNSQLRGQDLESGFNRTEVSLDKYTTPAVFKMGVSMVAYEKEANKLTVMAQLNHPNDNAENIRFGAEMEFKSLLWLRAGYKLSVKGQNFPSFGVGYKLRIGRHPLYVDYAMNPTNRMGVQHIVGMSVPFNRDERT